MAIFFEIIGASSHAPSYCIKTDSIHLSLNEHRK